MVKNAYLMLVFLCHTTLKVFNSCLWYLNAGCSRHMTGDKSLFTTLKEKEDGYVTFGDGSYSEVLGKGVGKFRS